MGLFLTILAYILTYWYTDNGNDEFITLFYYTVVIILAFSIHRIRKYSKLLVKNKIFVNECLMITHIISFAGVTASYSAYTALFFYELSEQKFEYINSIIGCLNHLFLFGVFITMDIMFIKHSKPLSDSQKVSIT